MCSGWNAWGPSTCGSFEGWRQIYDRIIMGRWGKTGHSTHMPELRTWYKTLRALFHLSTLLDARQSFRAFSMRSMSSCFFPDLLSIVQHSSLNPAMICLRRSTVLCLTLTLRPYEIIVRVTQGMTEERRTLLRNHPRDRRRTW
jgi:hypothetical protein